MFKKLSLFLCLSLCSAFSQAAPITWNLDGVTFDDGAIATGSFVFDVDAFIANDWDNILLDWNMSVSGGDESIFPAFTYNPTTAPDTGVFSTGSGYSFQFWVDTNALGGTPESRTLVLTSDAPLTNSGGTVPLFTQIEPGTWQSRECYNCNPYRIIVSGSLNAVPIPSAVWLFGSGLIGLIGIARRKKA